MIGFFVVPTSEVATACISRAWAGHSSIWRASLVAFLSRLPVLDHIDANSLHWPHCGPVLPLKYRRGRSVRRNVQPKPVLDLRITSATLPGLQSSSALMTEP
jgi:hypothetical protein